MSFAARRGVDPSLINSVIRAAEMKEAFLLGELIFLDRPLPRPCTRGVNNLRAKSKIIKLVYSLYRTHWPTLNPADHELLPTAASCIALEPHAGFRYTPDIVGNDLLNLKKEWFTSGFLP